MTQRIHIQKQGDVTVYSVGAWPGWGDVIAVGVGALVISAMFGGMLCFIYWIPRVYYEFFNDFLGVGWLHSIFMFIFFGAINLSIIVCLGLSLLFLPYVLIYQLSPKQFWIENDTLFHTARLLGFIPYKRKIPFGQVLDVQAEASNGKYAVTVLYERSLPKWLFVILVYWNEKFTQWPMMLVNGIPTMEEARNLQTTLLEPMTASPVCRVGTEPVPSRGDDGAKAQ